MNISPSSLEPPFAWLKRRYWLFWMVLGFLFCTFSWQATEGRFSVEQRLGIVVLTALCSSLGPAVFVYLTRVAKRLIDELADNGTARGLSNESLDRFRDVFSVRRAPSLLLTMLTFGLTLVCTYIYAPRFSVELGNANDLPLIAGGLIGFFLGSLTIMNAWQCFRVAAFVPDTHFNVGFQRRHNPLIARLQAFVNQGAILATSFWLLQLLAFYLIGVASEPLPVAWLLISSFFPMIGAIFSIARAYFIIGYLKCEDLDVVHRLIEAKLATMNASEAGDIAAMNGLLELQERVSKGRDWPVNWGSLVTLALTALAPAVQLSQQLTGTN